MIKQWIVTGSRGFIGTNFCNLLAENNQEFYGIDAEIAGSNIFETEGTKACKKQYKYDLCDNELYDELQKDFLNDYKGEIMVVHFAAFSHVDQSIKTPVSLVTKNIQSTYTIAEWCARNNINFVNIGTDEVYGELNNNWEQPFKYYDKINPRNPYSASKAASEVLIESLKAQYPNWKVFMTRCVNNIGKYQDYSKLIPVCINALLKGEKIKLYGKGEQIRTWIDVKIHNKVVFELANKIDEMQKYNNIRKFCIGSKHETTNRQIANMISFLMDNDYISDKHIEYIQDPRGNSHDFRYALEYRDTENFLGHSIDESPSAFEICLRETVQFYKEYLNEKTKYWKSSNS